jgi:hypothetical protein
VSSSSSILHSHRGTSRCWGEGIVNKLMIVIYQLTSRILVQDAYNIIGCFIIHLLFMGRGVANIEACFPIFGQTFVQVLG